MMNPIVKSIELSDGRTITLETGKLAKQADGAVTLRMGDTMLLATVCAAKDATPGTDFMPLQVEYREKFSAFGRFPGGFMKREARPSDSEILTCRLIDRVMRPLFPDDYHADVFVNVILFSSDGKEMPDSLAGLAASAALAVSDIPFNGPISEVRVARVNGNYIINPTFEELKKIELSQLHLEQSLLRTPKPDEIAKDTGLSTERVLELLEARAASYVSSLDSYLNDEESTDLLSFLGEEDKGYSEIENSDFFKQVLGKLSDDEKSIIIGRYVNGLSQRAIAEKLNVSQMYVSRMERKILDKLRKYIA